MGLIISPLAQPVTDVLQVIAMSLFPFGIFGEYLTGVDDIVAPVRQPFPAVTGVFGSDGDAEIRLSVIDACRV